MKKLKVKIIGGGIFYIVLTVCLIGCEADQSEQLSVEEALRNKAAAIEDGHKLYLSYGCAVCHGKNGDGKGLTAKQYYPPPVNFHDVKAFRHGYTKQDMRKVIKFGVREENSGMPAFDHFSEQELDHITSYLESLRINAEVK